MEKQFHPTLYTGCNYLSMMGLKLIHISKRGNWWSNPLDITLVVLTINCLCKTFPDFVIKVLCFLTTINLTFKFQLMVHEKLSWRNCKCPVDLWQPGQIVLKKFHRSKNPAVMRKCSSKHTPAIRLHLVFLYQLNTPQVSRFTQDKLLHLLVESQYGNWNCGFDVC